MFFAERKYQPFVEIWRKKSLQASFLAYIIIYFDNEINNKSRLQTDFYNNYKYYERL